MAKSNGSQTFEAFVTAERERISKAREELQTQLAEVQGKIAALEQEGAAIEAYVAVKEGRAPVTASASKARTPRALSTGTRAPRGSRTQAVLDLIAQNSDGLGRASILEKLGVKGDKQGEASVSNALANLKKQGKIGSRNGLYVPA